MLLKSHRNKVPKVKYPCFYGTFHEILRPWLNSFFYFAVFQCGICNNAFASPRELQKHIRKAHQTVRIYCDLCSETFTSPKELARHMKKGHKPSKTTESNELIDNTQNKKGNSKEKKKRIFQCFLCKTEYDVKAKLRIHMKLHKRNKPCKVCKVLFTVNELSSHLCDDKKSIRCDYCTNDFTTTLALLNHIDLSHENKKFYGCEKCPTFFPMVALKEIHALSHAQDEPRQFACNLCSKAYTRQTFLTQHIKKRHEQQKCMRFF